jgi:hypothetical protein
MPTILKTKNSVTTTVVPTSLAQGELAVNITDKKIWVGNAATTPILLVGGGSDGAFANLSYTGTLTGSTGIVNLGSGQFYKDANGQVGVGVIPNAWSTGKAVEVGGSGGALWGLASGTVYSTAGYYFNSTDKFAITGNYAMYSQLVSSDGSFRFVSSTATGTAGNNATMSERMRIVSGGNVGIGTGSPTNKLDVVGGTGTQNLAIFRTGDATAANNAGGGFVGVSSATAGSRSTYMWLDADGANLTGSDYFYIEKKGNSGAVELIQVSNAAMTFHTNSVEQARISASGFFQFNSGYGSSAIAYGCRAWVNFDGAGTVAIRGSGNVSSITDNGVGQYTLNFTTAMPDANYSLAGAAYNNNAGGESLRINTAPTTSSVQVLTSSNGNAFDSAYTTVAIFR